MNLVRSRQKAPRSIEADPDHERPDAGRPIWSFVAAIFITPLALIEYAIDWYYRFHRCTLGGNLCHEDTQVSIAALLIPWLLFVGAWIALWLFHPKAPTHKSLIWRLSQTQSIRELLTVFAALTLIGFIWATFGGRGSLEIGMVTPIVIAVAIHSYFWRPAEVDRESMEDQAPPVGV